MNINFNSFNNYNHLEYFELIWHYERLVEYRKKENDDTRKRDGNMSLGNLGSNMMSQMRGDNSA